jgi:thioredoxin-related protein
MRRLSILLTALFLTTSLFSTAVKAQETVNWQPIQQAETLANKQHRKIFIEIYTQWSEGFKELERSVLTQSHLSKYLNDTYVAVKFDAETREEVTFQGRTYKFVSQSGVGFNELASELLRGQLVYPTLVFLEEDGSLIQAIQYRTPEQFEMIITYFGSDNHKKMPWKKYERVYQAMKK